MPQPRPSTNTYSSGIWSEPTDAPAKAINQYLQLRRLVTAYWCPSQGHQPIPTWWCIWLLPIWQSTNIPTARAFGSSIYAINKYTYCPCIWLQPICHQQIYLLPVHLAPTYMPSTKLYLLRVHLASAYMPSTTISTARVFGSNLYAINKYTYCPCIIGSSLYMPSTNIPTARVFGSSLYAINKYTYYPCIWLRPICHPPIYLYCPCI